MGLVRRLRYRLVVNGEEREWWSGLFCFTTGFEIGGMDYMEGFRLSPDCMIEKSSRAIARELMKGAFVVGRDYKNKQLILENVFHYTASQKRMEIYTLFPDKSNEKRQLKLDTAFVFVNGSNILKSIMNVLDMGLNEYDLFVIDKHNNIYTETVYDKYGGSMRLA